MRHVKYKNLTPIARPRVLVYECVTQSDSPDAVLSTQRPVRRSRSLTGRSHTRQGERCPLTTVGFGYRQHHDPGYDVFGECIRWTSRGAVAQRKGGLCSTCYGGREIKREEGGGHGGNSGEMDHRNTKLPSSFA